MKEIGTRNQMKKTQIIFYKAVSSSCQVCRFLLFESFLQCEASNVVDIFASNVRKISLLQRFGLLIKSKSWDMIFL